jgi:2-polyprenyl-6-methoxyphenol hydroxylase-like FAD-dependent oxidoreductase
MTYDTDVLVVGAGPAGSALATLLTRRGFAVTLADKKSFPRPKPCGEFLSPECRPYLDELGVIDALGARGVRLVHGMRLHAGKSVAEGRFRALDRAPYNEAGFSIRRERLDAALVDVARAGSAVRWLERHDFQGLLRSASGVVDGALLRDPDGHNVPLRARFTVGADGVRSRVAQELGVHEPLRWLDRIALVGRFDGVAAEAAAEVHFVDNAYFAATTVDDGSFHLNLLCDRSELRASPLDVDAFVHEKLQEAPRLAQRLASATRSAPWRGTGPLAFRTKRQACPGAALVGDACGYVDPLTGEGIYFALHGAKSLSIAIESALSNPATADRSMRDYEARRRREVGPRLALAALLQRGLRHPAIVRTAIGALRRIPRLCDLLVNLTGDAIHPRDLLSPSFWREWHKARRSA